MKVCPKIILTVKADIIISFMFENKDKFVQRLFIESE